MSNDPDSQGDKQHLKVMGWVLLMVVLSIMAAQCSESPTSDRDADMSPPSGAALLYHDGQEIYVNASRLNVRDTPLGEIVGSLKKGTSKRIKGRSDEWLQIQHGYRSGWISAKYVTADKPKPTPAFEPVRRSSGFYSPPSQRRAWIGKTCKKGKPCGNACIAQHLRCHK